MQINERIKRTRLTYGLSDVELAPRLGIAIYEYGDIEFHEDERRPLCCPKPIPDIAYRSF